MGCSGERVLGNKKRIILSQKQSLTVKKILWGFLLLIVLSLYFPSKAIFAQTPTIAVDFGTVTKTGSPLVFGGTQTPNWQPVNELGWQLLSDVGVTFIRQDLMFESFLPPTISLQDFKNNVNNVQNPATWHQGGMEYVVNKFLNAKKLGMKTMAITTYAPAWLTYTGTSYGLPKDWAVWQQIVSSTISYFKTHYGVTFDYYEVWNEPGLTEFFNPSGSGLNAEEAYREMYYQTWQAIRSVDSSTPIGGPAQYHPAAAATTLDLMLQDSRINSKIDFVSFHYYDDLHSYQIGTAPIITPVKNILQKYNRSIPMILSEYNATCCGRGRATVNGIDATSYIGNKFVEFLNTGVVASGYFTTSGDCGDAQLLCMYKISGSSISPLPVTNVWRLASVQLGLGNGSSKIVTTTVPDTISAAGAVNSKNIPVILISNPQSTSMTVNLSATHLPIAQGTANVDIYYATQTNNATAPSQTKSLMVSGSSAMTTITLPPYSSVGVRFSNTALPSCVADINNDNVVDIGDYAILAANYLKTILSNSKADINMDGVVDISDYSILVQNFLHPCQ